MPLENVSTIEKHDLKKKAIDKQKKKSVNRRFYHSVLTIMLIACIIELAISGLINISKIVMFKGKINKSLNIKDETQKKHDYLSKKTNTNDPIEQAEIIARNKLKMAANDEVLILINNENEEEEDIEDTKTFKGKIQKFLKKYHINTGEEDI